jgi:CspA family cold shock protein
MPTGTVKWFDSNRGYGFIQPDDGGGRDVFVHATAVERAQLPGLAEGQKVQFEIERDAKSGKDSAGSLSLVS